jgi:hypothetical protein
MVVWGFEIGELLAAALRYRHLRFQQFCIKIIREMPKTLEDVADLGSYICALDKG